VVDPNREVEQAVAALTAEILKLSPLEGDPRDALSITVENALSRLAIAILAQATQPPAGLPPAQPIDPLPPALSSAN
jgi:hypothetical protein